MCARKTAALQERDEARPEDFRDPIEAFYADHVRLQACCDQLLEVANDASVSKVRVIAMSILKFLENDLPTHVADEEEDLFPILRERSQEGDKIFPILELLTIEHRDDIEFGRPLLEPLRRIAAGKKPTDPVLFANYVRAFRTLQRRHQAMENNVVLPLAFDRLNQDDLDELGRRMAARRGLSMT